mmetsp:Transcript_8349/g.17202  ORF Transcript_8349/g.17202 Transcript_8349/m.17202 type:complete len:205 (+) Transcript_8349:652-1266(+)
MGGAVSVLARGWSVTMFVSARRATLRSHSPPTGCRAPFRRQTPGCGYPFSTTLSTESSRSSSDDTAWTGCGALGVHRRSRGVEERGRAVGSRLTRYAPPACLAQRLRIRRRFPHTPGRAPPRVRCRRCSHLRAQCNDQQAAAGIVRGAHAEENAQRRTTGGTCIELTDLDVVVCIVAVPSQAAKAQPNCGTDGDGTHWRGEGER